jgi:hypothetical protein
MMSLFALLLLFMNLTLVQAQLCAFDLSESIVQSSGDLDCASRVVQLGSDGTQRQIAAQSLFRCISTEQFGLSLSLYDSYQPLNTVNSLQIIANQNNTSLTHAFWLYVPSLQHSLNVQYIQSVVEFYNPDNSNFQYGFTKQDSNGRYAYLCAGVDLVGNAMNGMQGCTDMPLSTRRWIHLAIIVNSTQISIVVDGQVSSVFEANALIRYNSAEQNNAPAFQLGSLGGDETTAFTGRIRQFVYAQYAMPIEQIQLLATKPVRQNSTVLLETDALLNVTALLNAATIRLRLPESPCSYIQNYNKELIPRGVGFKTVGCGLQLNGVLNASYTKSVWVHWDRLVAAQQPMHNGPISLISNANRNTRQYVNTPLYIYNQHAFQLETNRSVCAWHDSSYGIAGDPSTGVRVCSGDLRQNMETWTHLAG